MVSGPNARCHLMETDYGEALAGVIGVVLFCVEGFAHAVLKAKGCGEHVLLVYAGRLTDRE